MREESWDIDGNDGYGEYRLSYEESFIVACSIAGFEKDFWYVLSLANHWFNDLRAWAEQVAGGGPFDELLVTPGDVEAEAREVRGETK